MIAGRILAEAGDVARFATKDKFASYNGTAPIDVSSGDQVRHRLSRAGNRRINHALHMMAVTQIRYPGTAGRRYYERKRTRRQDAQGSAAVPQAAAVRPGLPPAPRRPAGQNRNVRITYDPAADAVYIHLTGEPLTPRPHHHPGQPRPASRRSSRWTGKTTASSASKSSTPAAASTPTSSTKPKSSANNGRLLTERSRSARLITTRAGCLPGMSPSRQ